MDKVKADKIKVLFLSRWYPNRYDPMPGLFVERHAEAVARSCQVSLLYVHPDEHKSDNKAEFIIEEKNGLYVMRIYFRAVRIKLPLPGGILKTWKYYKFTRRGIKIISRDKGKPDIVHVNILTRLGLIALINKILSATPYIITEHWSRYLPVTGTYKGFFRKKLTKLVVRNACAVTTVTHDLMKAMKHHALEHDHYSVVPNVVDTDGFTPLVKKEERNKKRIIHISCFEDRSKNISGILRTVKTLAEKRDDFELILVGEGFNLDDLKLYARQLGILDRSAFFKGLLEGDELIEMLRSSDFMVMFSNYENMPVVINESLACGVPVISTDVGGIREVVSPDTGILIERGDEAGLFAAIDLMLDTCHNYDSCHLRQIARQRFSPGVIADQFMKIYNDCIR